MAHTAQEAWPQAFDLIIDALEPRISEEFRQKLDEGMTRLRDAVLLSRSQRSGEDRKRKYLVGL